MNLIAAVTKNSILHYQINEINTNTDNFFKFIEDLNKTYIKKDGKNRYVIILDNFIVHKTQKILEYYKKEKLNIIFNIPYCSQFNCIELFLRSLNQQFYSNLYNNIEELKTD